MSLGLNELIIAGTEAEYQSDSGSTKNIPYLAPTGEIWGVFCWFFLGGKFTVLYSIMMLVKFSDLSQSDRSNWVMWQVKDPCPRPGWDGCLTQEKMAFLKSVTTLEALENKCESVWWWQISSKTLVCLGWGNFTIVNNLYFQNIVLSKHFD